MNRHQRRAQRTEIPPAYVAAVKRLIARLQGHLDRGLKPAFRLPPKDVYVIATIIDVAGAICANDDATSIVHDLDNGENTIAMLDAACQMCGVPVERVSLEQLGLRIPAAGSA